MKVLVLGLGYIGTPLAETLAAAGHEVHGVRRHPESDDELAKADVKLLGGDLTQADGLAGVDRDYDWVVNCVSSSRGGIDAYRATFLNGAENLCHWLGEVRPARFVFTSSSSVYDQTDGARVDEDSPAAGAGETGKILVEAERCYLAAASETTRVSVLRIAGIYGPERGFLFQKFLRDEATITGDPDRYLNQVHRDDVVCAIQTVLQLDEPPPILNVADSEPVTQLDFYRWLSQRLQKLLPPPAPVPATRKRAVTNKRVSNARLLKLLDAPMIHPTFREGYESEIQRLGLDRA